MYVSLRNSPTPAAAAPAAGVAPTPSRHRGAARARKGRGRVPGVVLALGLTSLFTDISSEAVTAVLPLYLTAVLGLGPVAYGFVDGIYQGAASLVRVLGGWWSDRSGRPKLVAGLGYGISALSRVLLLPVAGVAALTGVVALDRLGKGLRTGPRDAMIAGASTPEQLGRNFGVHRALDTAGADGRPAARLRRPRRRAGRSRRLPGRLRAEHRGRGRRARVPPARGAEPGAGERWVDSRRSSRCGAGAGATSATAASAR